MSILTRFPPEPNGYLHLGHVKAIWFDFFENKDCECILRLDDTNPEQEKNEYVSSIINDITWLGLHPSKITKSTQTNLYEDNYEQLKSYDSNYHPYTKVDNEGIQYIRPKDTSIILQPNNTLQRPQEMLFHDISYETKIIGTNIQTLKLKMIDAHILIANDHIIVDRGFVQEYSNDVLMIWDPTYTENLILANDGNSIQDGYNMRNYNGTMHTVKENKSHPYVEVDLTKLTNFEIDCENCRIDLSDDLLKNKNIEMITRGLNTINTNNRAYASFIHIGELSNVI